MLKLLKIVIALIIIMLFASVLKCFSFELFKKPNNMEYNKLFQDNKDSNSYFYLVLPTNIQIFYSIDENEYLICIDYYNIFSQEKIENEMYYLNPKTEKDNILM